MKILIIAVSSIIFYTHVLPILDRLTEYIQTVLLTKKMKIMRRIKIMEIKQVIQKSIEDCHTFYNTSSEYGVGFLDGLQSLCDYLDIKYTRTVDNLILEVLND